MTGLSLGSDRLSRPRFPIGIVVWALLLVVGAVSVWWGFSGPSEGEQAPTAVPTPTETPSLVPLFTQPPAGQVGPTTEPGVQPPATIPLAQETFGYGIATAVLDYRDPNYVMQQVRDLGLGWVKMQVRWESFDADPGLWGLLDGAVDAANQRGLRVMLSVVDAPPSTHAYRDADPRPAPPDNLALYADFVGQLVDRYRGRIHAIEVWNEQNLDREWDTAEGINPARYVEMLRLAYQAIKSRDPNIIVISGALSPAAGPWVDPANANRIIVMDDFEYLDRMIAAGALNYCDCVGAHHNGINIPPSVYCDGSYQDATATFRGYWDPPQPPHHSWCFRTTLEGYHQRIAAAGYNTPLCVTEFGWASSEGLGGYPPGFEFAQDNTLQEQADYAVQAFQMMRQWGFVRLAFLWNLDYANNNPATGPNVPYSITDIAGAPRPAFWAIMQMEKP